MTEIRYWLVDGFKQKEKPLCFGGIRESVYMGGQPTDRLSYIVGNPRPKKSILYIPGLAGDTANMFADFILNPRNQRNYLVNTTVNILLHSGIQPDHDDLTAGFKIDDVVNNKRKSKEGKNTIGEDGVLPDDWIEDARISLLHDLQHNESIKIIAHSFGGLFALIALGELFRSGLIDKAKNISLALVSSPTYNSGSLPDEIPLRGSDKHAGFTFYHDGKTGEPIPMASYFAFDHIWDYLNGSKLIKVNPNREFFNIRFRLLFDQLEEAANTLKNVDIRVISLFPYLDRWVSGKAGEDLKKLLGNRVMIEKFDLPSASIQANTRVNAHDMVDEWLPIALKF